MIHFVCGVSFLTPCLGWHWEIVECRAAGARQFLVDLRGVWGLVLGGWG
jgi:hypothetical protein